MLPHYSIVPAYRPVGLLASIWPTVVTCCAASAFKALRMQTKGLQRALAGVALVDLDLQVRQDLLDIRHGAAAGLEAE